ncbi:MAG: NUDIX hydrolase [Phycisphaerales bacterium]
MNLPAIIARRTLHHGRKFDYQQVTVRHASGREHAREFVRHPGAVVVVPVLQTPGGPAVVLIRVYRAAIDAMSLECCAGTLEPGEDPAACAGRELIEETGYRAASIAHLASFRTSPGLSDELMHAFLATGLTHVGQDLEDDEEIEVRVVPAAEALALIDCGEIADGKSIAALCLAARRGHLDASSPAHPPASR